MADLTRIGATTFRKMTGITPALMRALESTGIIHPLRADSGWRSFSQKDVDAVLEWKAARAQERAALTAEQAARRRAARTRR